MVPDSKTLNSQLNRNLSLRPNVLGQNQDGIEHFKIVFEFVNINTIHFCLYTIVCNTNKHILSLSVLFQSDIL